MLAVAVAGDHRCRTQEAGEFLGQGFASSLMPSQQWHHHLCRRIQHQHRWILLLGADQGRNQSSHRADRPDYQHSPVPVLLQQLRSLASNQVAGNCRQC